MTGSIVRKHLRRAKDARWRMKALRKIKVVSDPDGTAPIAIRIAGAAYRSVLSFQHEVEKTTGEMGEAFASGTDLGDMVRIGQGDTDALSRFVERRRRPIYKERWDSFEKELREEIHQRMELEGKSWRTINREVAISAAVEGAAVLSHGWEGAKRRGPRAKEKPSRKDRKPIAKKVRLGSGPPVILREPTPLDLADVLSGDAATLGERLLRVSIVGCGGWTANSLEEVDLFLREGHFSPRELSKLIRAAKAFVVDCIVYGRGAAFYRMSKSATNDYFYGRTIREVFASRRMEGEEILKSEEPSPEEIFAEREAVEPLYDPPDLPKDRISRIKRIKIYRDSGMPWKKIARIEEISTGYARNLGTSARKKSPASN